MEQPKRKQIRLKNNNYNSDGSYFITFCVQDKISSIHAGALHKAPVRGRSVISKIVGYIKMNSSKAIHNINPALKVWQRSYYDHIIRNEADYLEKRQYIENNPVRWRADEYCG